jgi:hypothetical protein
VSDFITRANIDRYLELLRDPDLVSGKRAAVVKILIEEEDRLSKLQENLELAERRATRGRELLDQSRARLCSSPHLTDHAQAVRLVSTLKSIQHLPDHFCHQPRSAANAGL